MPRGSKPGERRGGRKPGVRNKVTADVKAAAVKYMPEAVKTLAGIMTDPEAPAAARVAAAKEILDRAAGKAPQAITDADGGRLTIPQAIAFLITKAPGADCRD